MAARVSGLAGGFTASSAPQNSSRLPAPWAAPSYPSPFSRETLCRSKPLEVVAGCFTAEQMQPRVRLPSSGGPIAVHCEDAAPCSGQETSVVEAARAAARLDVAAALLAFEAALLGAEGRLGRPPRRRAHQRLPQQFREAIDGVGAVALLGAEALG